MGATQVSILGPLLFNTFLNHLLKFNEKTDICNFTDDNTLFSCAQSINEKTMTENSFEVVHRQSNNGKPRKITARDFK